MRGHHAQNLLVLKSPQLSFMSDREVRAGGRLCADDTQASRLQANGRRCYLSQNIGPAVAVSARPAPPPLNYNHRKMGIPCIAGHFSKPTRSTKASLSVVSWVREKYRRIYSLRELRVLLGGHQQKRSQSLAQ